jgi:hypothetical protein
MPILQLIISFLLTVILIRLLFRKVIEFPKYNGNLFSYKSSTENLMDEEMFWQVIKHSKSKCKGGYQIQCQFLTQNLSKLSSKEIIQFDRTFGILMAKSYSYKLWEAAYSLNGGCSDDSFEYFRSWLIAQGKNKFYWTLKYPRLLLLIGVKDFIENYEGMAYCAMEAYQEKTGNSLPHHDIEYAEGGNIFSESNAFLKYPELALLAW